MSLRVPPSKGYGRHVGLGHGIVTCTRARAVLQPCPHVRVNPAALGDVEEDALGAHKVPGK